MAHIVIMPRQGNTVESCVIVGWNKKEGDTVQADSPLCDVETDKATFEVVAGAEGTVLKILHEAGDDVPVLEPIAIIGNAGEDWQTALSTAASAPPTSQTSASSALALSAASDLPAHVSQGSVSAVQMGPASSAAAVSPRARQLAARAAVDISGVAGTGPGGRIIERDVQAGLQDRPALTAAARAALSSEGSGAANLADVGTGIGGRLREADLGIAQERAQEREAHSIAVSDPSQAAAAGTPEQIETPIKGIRKIISDRMLQSLSSTAQFTLNSHARADKLQELRQRFKASNQDLGLSGITINDLVLFAVSRVLSHYPFMNAHKIDDRIITYRSVHLGLAVDTERGLMVPVIRNADHLSLAQISTEAKRLAAACQNGTITADELNGSTFTVTNLGALGIESFTPVINIPEVAILGVCSIELKPIAKIQGVPGDIEFVPHIGLSLTINHQVVDGAPAARFLKALCDTISQIDLWLAR
ncbi:MAG: 2-oxo acid dehydrogenase subunit E2 [Treponema sp.]|nr:2-oxo acid dehydrogenase subunit E2 [Treponema sp.]